MSKSTKWVLIAAAAWAVFSYVSIVSYTPSKAQVSVVGPVVPLGYCQLATMSASIGLASCSGGIPAGATMAIIQTETQGIRYRDDGTAPTSSVGMPVASGGTIAYVGTLTAARFIEQTASAKLNVLFYR